MKRRALSGWSASLPKKSRGPFWIFSTYLRPMTPNRNATRLSVSCGCRSTNGSKPTSRNSTALFTTDTLPILTRTGRRGTSLGCSNRKNRRRKRHGANTASVGYSANGTRSVMHGSKRLPKARSSGYSKRCPAGLGAMTVLSVAFLPCRLTRRRKRNAPASLQRSANKLRWGRPAHKTCPAAIFTVS